ncbi:hypothetical protein A8C56_04190 [Niabella ginsenosidivorans]|uniref:FecR family protein n=1 Tax=Niabella ginsenosidivorans TaxID=1176587 RepID=A0A1A9I145_9BACT|nr:FecR family protein [Niabella ginsenosidivorans]ANH80284.1 hypothetical protein A8C56_04190 [Niabella ginsenosidivorans]
MEIDDVLIQRFFNKQCTEEEAEVVSDFLRQHPDVLELYMGKAEWDEGNNVLPDEVHFSAVWKRIEQKRKRGNAVRLWVQRAVAIAVVIAGGVLFYHGLQSHQEPYLNNGAQKLLQETLWVSDKNETKFPETIRLPDSSLVTLYPSSAITYNRQGFNGIRNLSLKGQAVFDVKASKTRPFTVYSNGMYTTALGTRFRIKAYDSLRFIQVNLYRGRVRIAFDKQVAGRPDDYYLVPGNVLYFDRIKGLARLSVKMLPSEKENKAAAKGRAIKNWYAFENRNMAEVFDDLSAIYNVRIIYNPREIRGMNFIGKIEMHTPLERILNDIALVNDLMITKQGNTYIISWKK